MEDLLYRISYFIFYTENLELGRHFLEANIKNPAGIGKIS